MTPYLLVGAGGAIGAMLRYGFSVLVGRALPGAAFPYATLGVNVIGSFAMGLLVAALARALPGLQNEIRLFVAVGVLGGFTTFSSFSLDVATLFERGDVGLAAGYVVLSVTVSILAVFAGLYLVRVVAA
jgi:CrcB protein